MRTCCSFDGWHCGHSWHRLRGLVPLLRSGRVLMASSGGISITFLSIFRWARRFQERVCIEREGERTSSLTLKLRSLFPYSTFELLRRKSSMPPLQCGTESYKIVPLPPQSSQVSSPIRATMKPTPNDSGHTFDSGARNPAAMSRSPENISGPGRLGSIDGRETRKGPTVWQ